MSDSSQKRLFGEETLPLFSGTAQRAPVEPFTPLPASRQLPAFACPICHGTGEVQPGAQRLTCSCPAGAALRAQRAHEEVQHG